MRFKSLRLRLILPLLLASMIAAMIVASLSSYLGRQWAIREVKERFYGIEKTAREASFPLTTSVVSSLAKLTQTELVTVDQDYVVLASTVPHNDVTLPSRPVNIESPEFIEVGEHRFLLSSFTGVAGDSIDRTHRVFVLFDQSRIDAASQRAALLPLLTGLSTIAVLTAVMVGVSGRLARRLGTLKQQVGHVATGDFDSSVSDCSSDEIGQLGNAVNIMAGRLRQLWTEVNRQQREKLLHQISAGMAHQLRNTLTGARMAIELHQASCPDEDQEDVDVAIRELQSAEDYVKRLMLVGTGESTADTPQLVLPCLRDIESSMTIVAKHLRVDLQWEIDSGLEGLLVKDGPSFSAAVSNLTLNAMQVAKHVCIHSKLLGKRSCVVEVIDDGPGIDEAIADSLFEPFVSSKPEGMGLGLPLVQRSANDLNGKVKWKRVDDQTIFELVCEVTKEPVD